MDASEQKKSPIRTTTNQGYRGDMKKVRITKVNCAISIITYFFYFVTGIGISDKHSWQTIFPLK
ncbi:hypothetical protein YDYSG_62700 [Paenibacillus tyrfis]|nr:hypothetical protein YDYSG_62700 [Paenibacillus tyrfis]